MIGLIILAIIAFNIGKVAFDKGKNRYVWWAITVGVWFGAQFLGGLVIALLGGESLLNDDLTVMLIGLVCSVLGIAGLWTYLNRLPDQDITFSSRIDEIGQDEQDQIL